MDDHAKYVATGIALVFLGCCSNVITFEYLMREVPTCGNLLTVAQFTFIAAEGALVHTRWPGSAAADGPGMAYVPWLKANAIPLRAYLLMVVLFFAMSVINNLATGFDISVPLHMIFRSGSLIASMTLGYIILGKRYSLQQVAGVLLVSGGIFTVTYATALSKNGGKPSEGKPIDFATWLIGIGMLSLAILLSALLGLLQEKTYAVYGRSHTRETMFLTHALSLPGFALVARDIAAHAAIFSASAPFDALPGVPALWAALAANILLQYVCIRGVYLVVGYSTALTTTLVITLRKFASLLISIWLFSNPFTFVHWAGTLALFTGSLLYSLAPRQASPPPSHEPKSKDE
ncbi:UDP-xylose and UDP-N-acetylglucosamine transporter [Thecamonas trahens ATCC 50062]|uniref:UDP-xylose and UDP-N-acetylglucosamine transporter n=1 Tax=Thecamonas trahens ATCC 50062 TaxID=461836 RepID=A0A0L0D7F8_THETB|nr:UDP-xylose and UDP-N-acetylglucosamine transporter [Thecamonas trahens ATCC 50062]KNC47233.1 UDP-xylose and UDP-N-acetylglucosamine transporter [Thecamonas trahens ATCC 50062]|eukprot:XP_013759576.1 UDP-xylose and UDP-N-acetylglucosamine transporter [Thecamonas trahens ATCC 50062]